MEKELLLQVKGMTKSFGPTRALKGVDIDIPEGKLTILKGRSGSGKTTLLNILG